MGEPNIILHHDTPAWWQTPYVDRRFYHPYTWTTPKIATPIKEDVVSDETNDTESPTLWLVYEPEDAEPGSVHLTEIEALREAVRKGWKVTPYEPGQDLIFTVAEHARGER